MRKTMKDKCKHKWVLYGKTNPLVALLAGKEHLFFFCEKCLKKTAIEITDKTNNEEKN